MLHLSNKEQLHLHQLIDQAFSERILVGRKAAISQFFRNILRFRAGYRLLHSKQALKVIEVFYYPSSPLSHLLVRPAAAVHKSNHPFDEPELGLDYYSYEDIYQLILETTEISGLVIDQKEHSSFLDALNWENQDQLEFELVQKCWKIAKSQTKSNIKAFYVAGDSSGMPRDLDNGHAINEIRNSNAMLDYLKQQNIL